MLIKIRHILPLVPFWIGLLTAFIYSAELINKIVAVVNGEIITQRQLEQGKFVIEGTWGIQDMIELCILNQEAKKEGIIINSKVIEEPLRRLEENYSEEELKTMLRAANLTFPEYREWLEEIYLGKQIQNHKFLQIKEKARVQESEVHDFYLKLKLYLEGFSRSDEEVKEFCQIYEKELEDIVKVRIAYFIVKDEARADRIRQRLEEGKDSAVLAQELSLGSESFREGEINLGEIKPYIREAILSLKIREVCKIEEKESGSFWIIQLKKRKEFLFSEYKTRIEDYLKNKKSEEALQEWIEELREKADIRII